ncbi:hypothetical protein MIND_00479000 [Mycena indigotica]|uniref:Uncharacterized protein n=1 Tax=Mycena indigotica TaxID=2126181 RepID=A0A8H6SVW3_9AGAR|nr:uncharacterized protein MIND_00479000 [Mycena indigotica]KAF7306868.1 hypothetical protein MIND_00479000 [Mycena indigotica]
MATVASSQRTRKPAATPGAIHREMSPSPNSIAHGKPRTLKANSMPVVPSVMQIFGSSPPRQLPSPPQQERLTPPHHPRPVPHQPLPEFLTTLDVENWQMTPELMADIERADQAAHYQQRESPPKADPAVERVRATTERVSPKNDIQRRPSLRESPKTRPPISPTTSSFASRPTEDYLSYQTQEHGSPSQIQSARRAISSEARTQLLAVNTHGQTPPLQAMTVSSRTPDRSLPVQEEQEDDVDASRHYEARRSQESLSSPTPSSDLNPDGVRNNEYELSRSVAPEEEGGHTPRSPQSGLPPDHAIESERYPRSPYTNATIRARTRNGSTDQLGLQSLDPAMFADNNDRPPPQYVEQRRQEYPPVQRNLDSRGNASSQPVYMHPEDLQHYLDHPSYFNSPRPNAPIPPTPHSQTAAPSPSPLRHSATYDDQQKDYQPYSPVVPAGSPYPYPFNHVRRNHSYPYSSRQQPAYDAVNIQEQIQEQLMRQWQVYAQNLAGGHVSDSTAFSPASTPFQGYNPWAFLHANRTLGGGLGANSNGARVASDLRSMQSSPSHEPVASHIPASIGLRKKEKNDDMEYRPGLPRRTSLRKPPPRVESTQPRSTPEPDQDEESSGEETAGEPEDSVQQHQRFSIAEEGSWVGVPVFDPAADSDWVDEDDEGDGEDLLELEYHPSYVSNIEKRRRRWESKWEALVHAFNALDRQTDATLVLLANPSHTTQLHSLTSRSIKRNPAVGHSPAMRDLRVGFRNIAAQRRATRSHQSSLADRFMTSSNASGEGSDASMREEDLKRALGTALGSLSTLKGIYEQREARWVEEMRRIRDDRERVELLVKQVLGDDEITGRAM